MGGCSVGACLGLCHVLSAILQASARAVCYFSSGVLLVEACGGIGGCSFRLVLHLACTLVFVLEKVVLVQACAMF